MTMSQDNKQNENKMGSQHTPPVLPIDTPEKTHDTGGLMGKMQTVKSAWDKAPEGDKKSNALKHYQSAEKAQKAGNETEAMRELDHATKALA
jgi:hypothetical protein